MIFPLATLDDLYLELENTNRALLRLGEGIVVDHERLEERRQLLLRWGRRIQAQIAQMEAA